MNWKKNQHSIRCLSCHSMSIVRVCTNTNAESSQTVGVFFFWFFIQCSQKVNDMVYFIGESVIRIERSASRSNIAYFNCIHSKRHTLTVSNFLIWPCFCIAFLNCDFAFSLSLIPFRLFWLSLCVPILFVLFFAVSFRPYLHVCFYSLFIFTFRRVQSLLLLIFFSFFLPWHCSNVWNVFYSQI